MKPFFCWIDLETSGLDPDEDRILEVAAVFTDRDLNVLSSIERVIDHADPIDEIMARSNEFVRNMHTKNGLVDDIKKRGITCGQAENDLLIALHSLGVEDKQLYLAGNTIHFDRSFLRVWMPDFLAQLNYRQVDVSTLKILFQERFPHPKQDSKHRAMDDVLASIAELKHYLKSFDDELAHAAGG